MSGDCAIELVGIGIRFGRLQALEGVDLQIRAGERVSLLGPSGSGKTSLLRLVAGLEQPYTGEIRIGGCVVAGGSVFLPPEQRPVGMVFQDFALFPHLTVAANVAFGLARLDRETARTRVREALESVGALELAGRFPHTLSGGQAQRVALARALAPRPGCLLLDEPFSGLDASLRNGLREETRRILEEQGITALVVTHDAEEAMHLADRIVLLREGRVVQDGSPEDLYFRPVSAFAARFFGDVERFVGLARTGLMAWSFGEISAPDCPDGLVEILVRRQAFRFGSADPSWPVAEAEVLSSRLIGGRRLTVCRLCRGGRTFHAFHRATTALRPGAVVRCSVDPGMLHLFRMPGEVAVTRSEGAGELRPIPPEA